MTELRIAQPNDKQRKMLQAATKHIGFGGARGGGKSWAVRTKAKLLALRYPGIKLLIVRRTYPELINNHVQILRAELLGLAQYNDKDKLLRFPNGSTIHFMYCARDGDLDRLQGVEYDVIFLDEATQLSEYQMKTITACLRGVNGFPKRIYYTCNPGGQGHSYIKRIFIDRRYEAGEDAADYTFIQSLVTDNKALMAAQPDYIRQLEALPEKLRKAWLEGDWDIFEGQFFEELRLTPDPMRCAQAGVSAEEAARRGLWTHVLPPPRDGPPREWKLYRSFDWGYSKPFSCAWWAVDFDGRLYRILELYGCTGEANVGVKWTPDEVFRRIRQTEETHPWLCGRRIEGVADPAIWDQSGGESIAETAERYRVYFSPGDHKRIPGWMQCHYRLQFDENGVPMMYVYASCKAFLRTVPLLVYDPLRPEDLDTSQEDHVADEWRYMCMARPIAPKAAQKEPAGLTWGDPLAD
ncbi:MAG: phage terminase large subunit [Oscillospiraceae bacterium]|nr:phage terminase large subunit [Oscillospiraceae bacterium]